jgi:hypothetical protein
MSEPRQGTLLPLESLAAPAPEDPDTRRRHRSDLEYAASSILEALGHPRLVALAVTAREFLARSWSGSEAERDASEASFQQMLREWAEAERTLSVSLRVVRRRSEESEPEVH